MKHKSTAFHYMHIQVFEKGFWENKRGDMTHK